MKYRVIVHKRAAKYLQSLSAVQKDRIKRAMNKKHTAIFRMTDHRNDDYVPDRPEDRISLVWPLTREIVSLSVKHDAERRLQRHVTRLIRREG